LGGSEFDIAADKKPRAASNLGNRMGLIPLFRRFADHLDVEEELLPLRR
jgi:hypothetical protein